VGTVYKRKRRDGKPLRNYSIVYHDQNGKRITVSSGTSDKRAAHRILAEKEAEVALILSGAVDPLHEHYQEQVCKPAQEHLDGYLTSCKDKQAAFGLKQKKRHLDWLLEATGAARLTDILPDVVDARLCALSEAGISARSINLKLECARAFLTWCVKNGRLRSNLLVVIPRRNEVLDRRRVRRALTEKETKSLMAVARRKAQQNSQAKLRPLWYLFALLAGLRRSDLERLTWGAVDLEARRLTIRGGKAKRRVDELPLHPELVKEIRSTRPRNVLPAARVFPKPVSNGTRQKDFKEAGIVLVNDRGEHADLHALRVTYGTRLALGGVLPAVHQRLMRHSTVELTMRYYTKLGLTDLAEHGIDLLPGIETPKRARTRTRRRGA